MTNDTQRKHYVRRAAVGVAKGWSYSVGLTSLAATVHRIGGDVSNLAGHVSQALAKKQYRHETFQEAVDRLGLTPADLTRQAARFNTLSFSWMGASLLTVSWMLYLSWTGQLHLQSLLMCLSTLAMTTSKFTASRFRACQLRDRELYAFTPWAFQPGRW